MALSCYLQTGDVLPSQLSVANADTPILQQHGEQDDVVPLSAGLLAKEALIAGGYPVQWQTYPMPHSVIPVQLKAISAWLQQRFEM